MATAKKTSFKNVFVIDTNIILNDVEDIFLLSQNGENLIVIPETVLDETDSFKNGFDEINYQAREFARLYDDSEILQIDRNPDKELIIISSRAFRNGDVAYINVISKRKYDSDSDTSISANIRNDRKIIEIARDIQHNCKNTKFVSLDTMAKIRALSIGVEIHNLKSNDCKALQLHADLQINSPLPSYPVFEIESMNIPITVQSLCITDADTKPYYYYRSGAQFIQIDEKELNRQEINPQNMAQKVLSSQMLDEYYNVVVSDSPAGSGKTLVALSAAMRLLDTHKDKYDKIVYIRKTVISDTEELGFLKGDLTEKMSGYLAPLFSNLAFIVENKYKNRKTKMTLEEFEAKKEELITKYQIQSRYEGHLRGDNIRNAVVILDEFQNDSVSSARTILTRFSENCKVFVLGSTKQIDSKYLNKHNNALTFILHKISKDNMRVNLTGYNLTKTVRSAIAEWADEF